MRIPVRAGFLLLWGMIVWLVSATTWLAAQSATDPTCPQQEAVVQSYINDVPVYAYGRTYVYGVSPDFVSDVVLQAGNSRDQRKIVPKKSWEIEENHFGLHYDTPPKSQGGDFQPFLSLNLIDGKPETFWCSRGMPKPN